MKYRVFYAKSLRGTAPNLVADLMKTHVELGVFEAGSLGNLFYRMQGEQWSPNGEARPLIEKLGLSHTSMSVGDVVQEMETGVYYAARGVGWDRLI